VVLTGDGDPFADEESFWLKPARGKIKWIVFDIVFQEPVELVKA